MSIKQFHIITRAKDIYYVIFEKQSLGVCFTKAGATKRVRAFAKRNNVQNYITVYSDNIINY